MMVALGQALGILQGEIEKKIEETEIAVEEEKAKLRLERKRQQAIEAGGDAMCVV